MKDTEKKKRFILILSSAIIVLAMALCVVNKNMIYDVLKPDITISSEFENGNPKSLEQWQEINSDVFCLLEFEDDEIVRSIPVVQTEHGDEYMYRSVTHEYDSMGTVFLDEFTPLGSQNLILNGHSSNRNNHQFTFLKQYADKDYFIKHPTFKMVDQYGSHEYLIISLCEYDLEQEDVFDGWFASGWRTVKDTKKMMELTEPYALQKREINYEGQQLLTLLTCNMKKKNSRYVITAIKI